MKFIHTADCHIGAWRDPKMRALTHEAWLAAVDAFLKEEPDFVVLAGDFFNTAIPGIDSLKVAVKGLQKLKDNKIPVYAIAGSHDYSPSGKTMLDVLEEAGLLIDVTRGTIKEGKLVLEWTQDPKTKVKLAGILGRRGSLDKTYYEDLDRETLEQEPGEKIFLFHTSISELKPKELEKMDAQPASFLPKGCMYYAGGHVHITAETNLPGYKNIVYPGPLFPASFSELEKLQAGSYCVYEDGNFRREKLTLHPTKIILFDAQGKTANDVTVALEKELTKLQDTLVLMRVYGELNEGKPSDIDFRKIMNKAYEAGAYFVMKSTTKLTSKEYEEIHVASSTPEKVEEQLLTEHGENTPYVKELMHVLSQEVQDGEKKYEYEERIVKEAKDVQETKK